MQIIFNNNELERIHIKLKNELKILVIVPAFNEQDCIDKVIFELKNENEAWDVLIINDGSKDNTSDVAKSTEKALVIDLVSNLGIGGAVQTGFKFAAKNDYDICLQFDGDGQHIAAEINKLIEPILKGEVDVVIGSRFTITHSGWKSSIPRRMGIFVFTILNHLLIRQRITDSTSGFRAYNKRALKFLAEHYPMDYPEPEAIILLGKNGFKMKEIHADMRARETGTSSINYRRAIYYMIKVVLAILMTSIRPKIIKVKNA